MIIMKKYILIFSVLAMLITSGCAYKRYNTNSPDLISEQQAFKIALDKAEVLENEIVLKKSKLEFDDGIYKYEFEFRKGKTEFNIDVKADDGTIIEFEADND